MKQEITEKMEELALLRLCKASLSSSLPSRRREAEKKTTLGQVKTRRAMGEGHFLSSALKVRVVRQNKSKEECCHKNSK